MRIIDIVIVATKTNFLTCVYSVKEILKIQQSCLVPNKKIVLLYKPF